MVQKSSRFFVNILKIIQCNYLSIFAVQKIGDENKRNSYRIN